MERDPGHCEGPSRRQRGRDGRRSCGLGSVPRARRMRPRTAGLRGGRRGLAPRMRHPQRRRGRAGVPLAPPDWPVGLPTPGPQPGGGPSKRLASRTLRQRVRVVLTHRVRGKLPRQPQESGAAGRGSRGSWRLLSFILGASREDAPTRRKENQAQGRGALSMRRGRPEAGGEQCGAHALRAWRAREWGPRTPRRRWDGTATLTQPLHLTPGTEIPPRAPQTPWRGSTRPPRGRGPPRGRCTAGAWDALARAQPYVRASVSFQTNSRVAPARVTRKPVPRTSL